MGYAATPIGLRLETKSIPEPNSGCWLWCDAPDVYGYGRLQVGGKAVKAHRVSYEHYIGPVPQGMCVCHRCDTRSCVNPDHLFIGSNADNSADMVRKGRAATTINPNPGESNGKAKLSEVDAVQALLMVFQRGMTRAAVARELGVTADSIAKLCSGRTWKHLAVAGLIKGEAL